jgi:predicted nucleic acid-binding protein
MAPSASKMDQTHTDIQSVLHSQEQKIKALNNRIKDKDVLIFQLQDALKLAYARKYGRSL